MSKTTTEVYLAPQGCMDAYAYKQQYRMQLNDYFTETICAKCMFERNIFICLNAFKYFALVPFTLR